VWGNAEWGKRRCGAKKTGIVRASDLTTLLQVKVVEILQRELANDIAIQHKEIFCLTAIHQKSLRIAHHKSKTKSREW
jgi:hypothetical protein